MKTKVFLLALLMSISDVAIAKDFWQCVQANGKTVFSDMPCPNGQEQLTYIPQEGSFIQGMDQASKSYWARQKYLEQQRIQSQANQNTRPRSKARRSQQVNLTNPVDCNNAKRAWHFERDKLPSKGFNRTRLVNDVIKKCGGWPPDLPS